MRKLLLLINILCIQLIVGSCQSKVDQKKDVSNQTQSVNDSVPPIDTTLILQSEPPKTVGLEPGILKDTTNKPTKNVPIIHSSPEQEKIDSIKREKLKGKK